MQFVGWPDHGAPDHPAPVLQFMETVEEVWKKAPESQGPVVVHCRYVEKLPICCLKHDLFFLN